MINAQRISEAKRQDLEREIERMRDLRNEAESIQFANDCSNRIHEIHMELKQMPVYGATMTVEVPIVGYEFIIGWDGNEPRWFGYTDGDTWNGWECPMFPKETAEKVLAWINSQPEAYEPEDGPYLLGAPIPTSVGDLYSLGYMWCWEKAYYGPLNHDLELD